MSECPGKQAMTVEEVRSIVVNVNDLSLEELQTYFSILLQGISHSNQKNLVQYSDCLGIWFSYVVRKNRQGKDITTVCDECSCSEIFMFIIDHMGNSGGPLHNSLSKLLGKVCVYMKHFCPQYEPTIHSWIEIALGLPIYSKNTYFLLESLLKHADSKYIVSRRNDIIEKCVFALKHDHLANIASKVYYGCYSFYLDGSTGKDASSSWQDALYETLMHKHTYSNALSYLAPLFFQKSTMAFVTFVTEKYSWRLSLLNDFEVECLLKLSKLGKDLLIIDEPYLGDNPILPLEFVTEALAYQNEDLRMSAFALLTSSHKKSRLINREIYEVLMQKNLLKSLFLDSQKLEQRNEFSSMLRHFLTRIRDSSHALAKEIKNVRQKKSGDSKELTLSKNLQRGQNFLEWLLRFIKESILPGSTYSQLILSYSVLEILVQLDLDKEDRSKDYSNTSNKARSRAINNPINFPFKVTIYDQTMIRLIFDNILNNYEDIRHESVQLLLFCPQDSLQSSEIICDYKNVLKRSNDFLKDLKGKNSEGGALVYDFYSQYFRKVGDKDAYLGLITDLTEMMISADTNSAAFGKNAFLKLHGIYCTLSLLIPQSRECDADEKLKKVIEKAYDSVSRSCKEAEALLKEFDQEYTKSSDSDRLDVNYAWKVMKEGSRLIYVLCCLAGKLLSGDSYKSFLISSSELIMSQIAIIKHDGTLSTLNEVFIKLNEECFSNTRTDISELPLKWLEDSISMVKFKQSLIKRRSGGLPHLITGVLIAAATRYKEKEAQNLINRTISELMTIAKYEYIPNPDEKIDIPQVNALNTLKQIIEYPLLSKKCTLHANEILELTLSIYHSESWALRNCASMLFNAFQYLVFGTSREDRLFQQVPSKLFFGRFNGIDKILQSELNYAISQPDHQSRLESIFAILNLLSKLESSNTNDCLAKFYPHLERLLGVKSWKVREAAARTLAKIIPSSEINAYADGIKTQIETNKGNYNLVHGYLLFFLEILKNTQDSQCKLNFGQNVLHYFLQNAIHFFSFDCTWASGKCYIEIFDILCLTAPKQVDTRSNFDCLMSFLSEELSSRGSANLNGTKSLFQFTLCKSLLRYLLQFGSLNEAVELGCSIIQKSDQDDLIIHVLDFLDFEMSIEDIDTEVIQLVRDTVWRLIHDKGSWNHMLSKSLNVLIKFLQCAGELQPDTAKEKAEQLFSLCSVRSHLTSCKALKALCPYITSLNKQYGSENSLATRYFTSLAEKLRLEDDEAREYLYEALIYFQNNLQKEDIYREVSLLFLFDALSDPSDHIRYQVSIQLSKFLKNFPITPSFLASQLAVKIPSMLSSHPAVYRTLATIKRDHSNFVKKRIYDFLHESPYALFDLELSNLSENTIEKNFCISLLLSSVSQQKETPDEFRNMIQGSLKIELDASISILKQMPTDGPIGWSRHCYSFTALAETISDAYFFIHSSDHSDDVAILGTLSTLVSQRNLHPILIEMMGQPPVYNISG
ncbi:Piso0_002635 [Millerozyma farinosa CBS 7064]|uniref:Piso0_002635 protein n=1 Tax=Pichia sorbitophila (strain ATCC MYA-4447 / BCRC 22081 / CBS 7064 / NBRC 10061 / NRRL Y-12695) TaxID=559304 RepID=G8YD49_PICSO|nr:Piso0_002635 [Millerozyma farinosa CBS 7064]